MPSGDARPHGFAYVLLLASLAIVGMAAASSVSLGQAMARRDAEDALLVVGSEFARALDSFRSATHGSVVAGPKRLEDLLRDPRFPGIRRHLRAIHPDPLTGSVEWGLVRNPDGSILAIYSLAPGRPAKRTGFENAQRRFENADSYGQWLFAVRGAMAPLSGRSP